MIAPVFEGKSVAIVAGGPSLTGFDFGLFAPRMTLAINRAHEFLPRACVLWWTDASYWRRARESLTAHAAAAKATGNIGYRASDELPASVHVCRLTGLSGFDPDPECLRHGNNSAYAAMHLAAHLGARRIVLFGVDMKHGADGRSHFHGGYDQTLRARTLERSMLPYFASLQKPLDARGIEVLNASPHSALKVWPRIGIEEGLQAVSLVG